MLLADIDLYAANGEIHDSETAGGVFGGEFKAGRHGAGGHF